MSQHLIHADTTRALVERIEAALSNTRHHLPEALDLAWDWTATLPKQQTITFTDEHGETDQLHLDATEAGVIGLGRVPKDSPYARLLELIDAADTALAELNSEIRSLRRLNTKEARALYRATLEKGLPDVLSRICEQVACEDMAFSGPFCDPCQRWLESHEGSRVVPAEVVAERLRKRNYRERGKFHITGPLAEAMPAWDNA